MTGLEQFLNGLKLLTEDALSDKKTLFSHAVDTHQKVKSNEKLIMDVKNDVDVIKHSLKNILTELKKLNGTTVLDPLQVKRSNMIMVERRRQGNRKIVAPPTANHIDSFSESRVGVDPPTNTSTPNKPELSSHDSNIVPVQNDVQYQTSQQTPVSQSQQIIPVENDIYDSISEPTHVDHNYLPNQPVDQPLLKYSSNNEIIPDIMNDLTSDMTLAEQLSSEINKIPRQNVEHEAGHLALLFTEPLLSQYCEPEQNDTNNSPITYHIQQAVQAVPVTVVPSGAIGAIEYVGQPVTNLATLSPVQTRSNFPPATHQSEPARNTTPNENMETDLPILEDISKPTPKLPSNDHQLPQPPTKQPKLPQQSTEIVNKAAKTLQVFPPISPVPERKNPSEPLKRTCSVITPHKTTPSPSPPPSGKVSPDTPRASVVVPTSELDVPSKITDKDRVLSKEDEITASIKAGNAILPISSEQNQKSTKPKRKSCGPKIISPGSETKSDSSSKKRKAFKPKQVNASLSSLQRKLPTIMPQNDNKPTEIISNLPPAEFANLSGMKETSFSWKELSESEMNLKLSKNAQTFSVNKSPRDSKTKKKKTKKKVPTTLIQDVPFSKNTVSKRVIEKPKLLNEKPPEVPQKDLSKKEPKKDAVPIIQKDIVKNPEGKPKENLKPTEEPINEIRKSPRVKKRPADDSTRKSSRKNKPKKRKTRTPADLLKTMQFSDDEN